jgi:hypothetical protein
MYVSAEVITMLATAATTLVAIVSGFGWMINRMDLRFAAFDVKFDAKFDAMDARLDAKFDAQEAKFEVRFDRIEKRLDRVEHEVSEVKIAIARLEGPPPRLLQAR